MFTATRRVDLLGNTSHKVGLLGGLNANVPALYDRSCLYGACLGNGTAPLDTTTYLYIAAAGVVGFVLGMYLGKKK